MQRLVQSVSTEASSTARWRIRRPLTSSLRNGVAPLFSNNPLLDDSSPRHYLSGPSGNASAPAARRQRPIYVAATRQHVGKTSVSLALVSHLSSRFGRGNVGYMKAVGQRSLRVWDGPSPSPPDDDDDDYTRGGGGASLEGGGYVTVDKDVRLIGYHREHFRLDHLRYNDMSPVLIPGGYTRRFLDGGIDEGGQMADVRRAYLNIVQSTGGGGYNGANDVGSTCITICEGTGHAGVGSVVGAGNARVAAELGADALLVANGGLGRAFDELELNRSLFLQHGVNIAGVIINKVRPDKFDQTRTYLAKAISRHWAGPNGEPPPPILGVVPDRPYLGCPALADVESAFGSVLLSGGDHRYRHYNVGSTAMGRSVGLSMVTTGLAAFLRTMQRQPEGTRTIFVCHSTRDDVIIGFLGEARRRARRGLPFGSALVVCTGGDDGMGDNPLDSEAELSMEVCEMITDRGPAGPPVLLAAGISPARAAGRIRAMTPKFNASDKRRVLRATEHYEPYIDFDLLLKRTSSVAAWVAKGGVVAATSTAT